ncbi:MAG: class I SAM-dependent methyltransferase [Nitrospirota bacterium]
MDTKYWDRVAEQYDLEIFSVLDNDENRLISTLVQKYASEAKTASDFGCGIGKFLPLLSQSFGRVYAYDISEICLQQARGNCSDLTNIEYVRKDLSKQKLKMPEVDFILCVNSVIMPSISQRSRYFSAVQNHLHPGGHLLLVVPSFESAIYSNIRLIESKQRQGLSYGAAVMAVWNSNNKQKASHLQHGIVNIDHVPTKHFLKEELRALMEDLGFHIHEIKKIEYDWETEFNNPPDWLKGPYPWDWLVTAEKHLYR